MTTLATSNRSPWLRHALCAACCAVLACKHDADRVAAFVAATDELQRALCACDAQRFECEGSSVASPCEQRVVRKHTGPLASWLSCATREQRGNAECVRRSDCSDEALEACDVDVDDVCGEAPKEPSDAIEREIGQLCPESIDCEDGSTADGRFCNGRAECRDGSDESGCDGDSGGGASSTPGADSAFECGDGTATDQAFVCDGVADCADGSDEACREPARPSMEPVPPMLADAGVVDPAMCVAFAHAPGRINPNCVRCACTAAPAQVFACDSTCWSLIDCVLALCPDAAPGSSEQVQCATGGCADFIGAASAAMTVGGTLRGACSDVCPPF